MYDVFKEEINFDTNKFSHNYSNFFVALISPLLLLVLIFFLQISTHTLVYFFYLVLLL